MYKMGNKVEGIEKIHTKCWPEIPSQWPK